MKIVEMPVMGEGIHQGRIVSIKKTVGEQIEKDEIIYEIETDKAIMEIEAPIAGKIDYWFVNEGDVIAVGNPIVRIEPLHLKTSPRARRELLEAKGNISPAENEPSYTEKLLSPLSTRIYNLVGSKQASMLSASVNKQVSETQFKTLIGNVRKNIETNDFISDWQCFSFHLIKVLNKFPLFRSILVGNNVRLYHQFNFGIAVNTSEGELVTAVLKSVGDLSFYQFSQSYQNQISKAQAGYDQIEGNVPFILSILGNSGLSFAIPMLVPPASFVLYVSDLVDNGNQKIYNLTLTFNHLIVSGMQAADFLTAVVTDPLDTKPIEKNELETHNITDKILAILENDFNLSVDVNNSLGEQGVDSMAAVKLVSKLNDSFNLSLPAFTIWQAPTVEKLAKLIEMKVLM